MLMDFTGQGLCLLRQHFGRIDRTGVTCKPGGFPLGRLGLEHLFSVEGKMRYGFSVRPLRDHGPCG